MKKVIKIVLISAVAIFGMLLMIGLLADDEETQVQNSNSASESENDEKKTDSSEEESGRKDEKDTSEAYFDLGEKVTFELQQGGTVNVTLNDWGEDWNYIENQNLVWIDVTIDNPENEKIDVGSYMLNLAVYGDNEALKESKYGNDRLEDTRLDPGRSTSGKIYVDCTQSDYSIIEAQINNAKWILKDADRDLPSEIEVDEEELDIKGEYRIWDDENNSYGEVRFEVGNFGESTLYLGEGEKEVYAVSNMHGYAKKIKTNAYKYSQDDNEVIVGYSTDIEKNAIKAKIYINGYLHGEFYKEMEGN